MVRWPAALAALLVLAGCGGEEDSSDDRPESAGTSSAGTPSAEPSVEVAPFVEVGAGPVGLTAADDGSVWVVSAEDETVARIPAGGDAPDLTVEVPGVPLRTT